jgi:hypothetical protein
MTLGGPRRTAEGGRPYVSLADGHALRLRESFQSPEGREQSNYPNPNVEKRDVKGGAPSGLVPGGRRRTLLLYGRGWGEAVTKELLLRERPLAVQAIPCSDRGWVQNLNR